MRPRANRLSMDTATCIYPPQVTRLMVWHAIRNHILLLFLDQSRLNYVAILRARKSIYTTTANCVPTVAPATLGGALVASRLVALAARTEVHAAMAGGRTGLAGQEAGFLRAPVASHGDPRELRRRAIAICESSGGEPWRSARAPAAGRSWW